MSHEITDEEILSYILDDCQNELRISIEEKIENDPAFNKRVEVLSRIQKQVYRSPIDSFMPTRRTFNVWKLIPTCSLVILSFAIGLYIESQFVLLGKQPLNNDSVTTEKSISEPMDWDEERFLSFM